VLTPARMVFARFWPLARANRGLLGGAALLLVVAAGCDTAAIWLFSSITDTVLKTGDVAAFWWPAAVWAGVALLSAVLGSVGQYLTALAGERFLLALRDKVFAHLRTLSPDFFAKRQRGDLVARLTSDVESVEALVGSGVVQTFTSLVSVVFFAAAAVMLSWKLAVAAVAVIPLFVLAARWFARRVTALARVERARHGRLTGVIEEDLANMALVQVHGQPGRVGELGLGWMRSKLALARFGALYPALVYVLETVSVLAVIGFGAWEIAQHRLTLGGLFAFAAFLGYLYPPVRALGQLSLTVAQATTGSARLLELLDAEPTVRDEPTVPDPGRARGLVSFHDVGFRYPDTDEPVLDGFRLIVRPGELVAVTGASGAGKSTVAKLLLRFYDTSEGTVRLDGADVRTLPLAALRRDVSLLSQETLMFHATIAENIAYGRPDATHDEIVAAARSADADDFVRGLPDGYDTLVGDRGHRLSGGQRQRIAIARALLADAPVLVLDEPTSSLDGPAARRVIEPLRRLAGGRSTILITHDPRLVALADRVVHLPDRLSCTVTH